MQLGGPFTSCQELVAGTGVPEIIMKGFTCVPPHALSDLPQVDHLHRVPRRFPAYRSYADARGRSLPTCMCFARARAEPLQMRS